MRPTTSTPSSVPCPTACGSTPRWRRYGRDAAKDVPAVLAANPGLADADPVLPAGLVVDLPDLPAPAARPAVRLWGPK